MDRKVDIVYEADINRRLNLKDIRLTGTTQFTIDDILPALESQRANILGFIPIFGYGHGLTSQRMLEDDLPEDVSMAMRLAMIFITIHFSTPKI